MLHTHQSLQEPHTGQIDICTACNLEIIFDGKRWTWLYDIDKTKRTKLMRAFTIDRITGVHS